MIEPEVRQALELFIGGKPEMAYAWANAQKGVTPVQQFKELQSRGPVDREEWWRLLMSRLALGVHGRPPPPADVWDFKTRMEAWADECGDARLSQYLGELADSWHYDPDREPRRRAHIERAVRENVPGVYVYTYPELQRLAELEDTLTLLKVGHSAVDAAGRIDSQARTGWPSKPLVLRVFPTEESAIAESRFHAELIAAGHGHNGDGGREWFLSSLEFIDELAARVGLSEPI